MLKVVKFIVASRPRPSRPQLASGGATSAITAPSRLHGHTRRNDNTIVASIETYSPRIAPLLYKSPTLPTTCAVTLNSAATPHHPWPDSPPRHHAYTTPTNARYLRIPAQTDTVKEVRLGGMHTAMRARADTRFGRGPQTKSGKINR
jgi:hypothetical protein